MFIEIDRLPPGVLGFEAHGRITSDDRRAILIPGINSARSHGDKLKLLYVTGPDFSGYDEGALFDEAVFGTRHFTAFERIAYVGEDGPYARAVDALDGLIPAALRRFNRSEIEQAKIWLAG